MSLEGNDRNRMEILRTTLSLPERRLPRSPGYPAQVEKGPGVVAWWGIVRKRRWIVLTAFAVLFGAVLIESLAQRPTYRAKSLIEIDKESPGFINTQGGLSRDEVSDDYLETQYKVLSSDDLSERVIRQLGLDQRPEFWPVVRFWSWRAIISLARPAGVAGNDASTFDPLLHEHVLEKFQEHLDIRPIRRSRVVEIRFDSHDPDLAAQVVNAVAANYIQKNLEARWDAAQNASGWLSQQLQDLKAKLEKSQEEMQKYAAANELLFLESDKGSPENIVNQSVRELQEELTRAQADRFEKESLFRLVQSGDYASLPGVVDNRLLQDLGERLADLQREHAQLAATFTEEYPKVREIQSQIAEVQSAVERERRNAARKISNDYFAAVQRERLVQSAFAQKQGQANRFAEKAVQYGILSREVDSNKAIYDGLLQRLKEADISAALKASNIRIVDPGKASYKPISPNLPLNLGLAAFLGLGLGVSLAFLREALDLTIRDAADAQLFLGVPVLGFVPSNQLLNGKKGNRNGTSRLASAPAISLSPVSSAAGSVNEGQDQRRLEILESSPLSEPFREIRTSVTLSGEGRGANSILVTSAEPGEGKTTVAVNLAVSLAQLGQPVLLVDADLRRPSIDKYFPFELSQLSGYLLGRGAWQEMVHPTPVSYLHVLNAGPVPENPAELLSADRMRALLREAITTYSFVILDSPPLLKGADSRILGSMTGATILVVTAGETPRQVAQFAESQARSVGTNFIGVVLNHLDLPLTRYSYPASRRLKKSVRTA